MTDRDTSGYQADLICDLVQQINELQLDAAAASIEGTPISAEWLLDKLDAMLEVESPDGEGGILLADEGGWSIFLGSRITGESIISADFTGVVWNEKMDRAPRTDLRG